MDNLPEVQLSPMRTPVKRNPIVIVVIFILVVGVCCAGFFYFKFRQSSQNFSEENNSGMMSRKIATIPNYFNTGLGEYKQERFVFSGDGKEVMYPAMDGAKAVLMRNNDKVGDIFWIYNLEKSKDGNRVNYSALIITKTKDGIPAVSFFVNDIAQEFGKTFSSTNVSFSDDGRHYAYVVNTSDNRLDVIYDGKVVGKANVVRGVSNGKIEDFSHVPYSPILDSNGQRLLMVTMSGKKTNIEVLDLVTMKVYSDPLFDQVFSPLFSPDNKHYAYRAQDGKKDVIVLDGKIVSRFDNSGTAWAPVFSDDSSKIMFTTGGSFGAYDISKGVSTSFVSTDYPSNFQTDQSSQGYDETDYKNGISRLEKVYDAKKANWAESIMDFNQSKTNNDLAIYVNINGVKIPYSFGYVSDLSFDPTGDFVMFGARKGKELLWKVYKITQSGPVEIK